MSTIRKAILPLLLVLGTAACSTTDMAGRSAPEFGPGGHATDLVTPYNW